MSNDEYGKAETLSFSELLSLVEQDGFKAMRISEEKASRASKTARRLHYEDLAVRYRYAELLYDDADRFKQFASDSFWNNRVHKLKQSDSLRLACIRGCGSSTGPMADTACTEANALSVFFFGDPSTPAAKIPDELAKPGGLDRLLQEHRDVKKRANAVVAPGTSSDANIDDQKVGSNDSADDLFGLDEVSDHGSPSDANTPANPSVKCRTRPAAARSVNNSARQANVGREKYPDGTTGFKNVGLLTNAAVFKDLMSLDDGEVRWLRISRVFNGGSDYKRYEVDACCEEHEGVPVVQRLFH